MPAIAQTSSLHREPLVPSERQMHADGVTIRGDRPEASAVRTFEEFEGKARRMCGSGSPVIFTAVDWGLPRLVGEDVELIFTVHTGHRVAIRLPQEKAARLHEALRLTISGASQAPAKLKTSCTPAPVTPAAPLLAIAQSSKRTPANVEQAWQRFRSGEGSVQMLAAEFGISAPTMAKAFERAHGADFALIRTFYRGGLFGPTVKAAMDARLSADRQPVTKPNGKLL